MTVRFLAALLLCFVSLPSFAQTASQAQVVSACGTPGSTYSAGQTKPLTQDTTGKLCDGSSGGVTAAVTAVAGASPPSYSPGANPFSENLSGGLRVQISLSGTDIGLGQQTKAASVPVVLPSDQTVPVNGAVSNATSGVATSSTNVPTVAYNYGFNGTTWDQLQVVPTLKNLKIDQASIAGTATAVNAGSADAGTQRVAIANGSGGSEGQVTSVPTVQNAAYSSGNCIGGFNAITVANFNGGSGFLQNLYVSSKGGSTPIITVYLFNANPSSSTCTDKSTFTLNAADIAKSIGAPFAIGLAAPTGTTVTFGSQGNLGLPFIAGGSSGSGVQTIYYALVSGSTFTPASTTDLVVGVGVSAR